MVCTTFQTRQSLEELQLGYRYLNFKNIYCCFASPFIILSFTVYFISLLCMKFLLVQIWKLTRKGCLTPL